MATNEEKIVGTPEAWETGQLGMSEEHAVVSTLIDQDVLNDSLDLQMISIRMQKGMIRDLKAISSVWDNMGYQTLIKNVLHRFIEAEMKQFYRQHAEQIEQALADADAEVLAEEEQARCA